MTDLVSSIQSASSSTPTAPGIPVVGAHTGLRMGTSPPRLREEAATASLRSSIGFSGAPGGLSPSLPTHRTPSVADATPTPRRSSAVRQRHSEEESLHSPVNSRHSGGAPPALTSLPLLPLLTGPMGSRKELFGDAALPSTPNTSGRRQAPGMSSSSTTDGAQQPTPREASPQLAASRPTSSTAGMSLGAAARLGANTSVQNTPLPKKLSTSALRGTGGLPESASAVGSSVSPVSRSAARLQAQGSGRTKTPGERDEDVTGLMGSVSTDHNASVSVPLPLIARPATSVSSSFQGRFAAPVLHELGASGMALTHSPKSGSSSHMSLRRDEDGPQVAPALALVIEASTAVGQPPPRPPYPLSLPASTAKRADVSPTRSQGYPTTPQSGRRVSVADMSLIDDEGDALLEDSSRRNSHSPANLFCAAPVLLSAEGGGGRMHPDDAALSPGASRTSGALGAAAGASLNGIGVPSSVAVTPIAKTDSRRFDAALTDGTEGTRPGTGNAGSGDAGGVEDDALSIDEDAAATAARGVTVVQQAGDAAGEDEEGGVAHHPKRAKRRLKKSQKEGKDKRREGAKAAAHVPVKSDAVASSGVHDGHAVPASAATPADAATAAGAASPAAATDATPPAAAASPSAAGSPAPPKSGSALARKRERKRQLKNAKLKEMSSEERRVYVEDHKRRRAAKKALREAEAAAAAAAPPPAPQSEVQGDAGALVVQATEALVAPAAEATDNAAASPTPHPPPPPLTSSRGADPVDKAALVDLAVTLSPQILASTCRPGGNPGAVGGQALLGMLGKARRCTSASSTGPGAPVPPMSMLPPKSVSSLSAPFRRRFLSDASGLTQQQQQQHLQSRTNSFVFLSSSTPTKVTAAGAVRPEAAQHGFDDDSDEAAEVEEDLVVSSPSPPDDAAAVEEAVDDVVDEDSGEDDAYAGSLVAQTMYGSGAVTAVGAERGIVVPQLSVAVIAPHRPPSAAGSGVAAIHGLKQQRQRAASSPLEGTNTVTAHSSGANEVDDLEETAREVSDASSLVRSAMNQSNASRHQQSSSVNQQPVTEASHSVELEANVARRDGRRHSARDASVSSMSYYTSYSASRDRSAERDVAAALATPSAAASPRPAAGNASHNHSRASPAPAAAAQKAARRGPRNPASSCSSLRSRSDDSGSDYGSSGYGSYSSYSSSGSLQPEVLPLAEGCTVPPPAAAFSDLKYRYACVSQLRSYAEPAIIHEWDLTEGCWGSVETSVVLGPQPFSQGNMRASYYMIDMRRLNCMLVAKRYLKTTVGDDQYFDDVSMHSIAGHWARVFNTMHPPKKVRFVPAAVLILPKRNPPLILAMEPQLTGKFVKYNNNCGYVRRKARWTPQAFSHFTYHASEHTLMVVDIQGVDDFYTDPQILSPDGEGYGRGNLGKEGIRRFLQSHKCNEVCRAVGLPPLQRNAKGVVIAPLNTSASGRVSTGPGTPAAPDRLSSASGLQEERLPPKAFTLATRRGSSSNASTGGGGGNGEHQHHSQQQQQQHHHHSRRGSASLDARRPGASGGAVLHSPTPPSGPPPPPPGQRQTLQTASGHPSPSSPAVMASPMKSAALPPRMGPAPNYGVKYVRYPRQALIRPQSQYFTSTVAGGLMAVPPQQQQQQQGNLSGFGSGVLTPHTNAGFGPVTEQISIGNGSISGAPVSSSSMVHSPSANANVAVSSSTSGAASLSPAGPAMLAVPMLRPPGSGVPNYGGGGSNGNVHGAAPMSGGAKAAPMIGPPKSGGDSFGPAAPKQPGKSPHLRPAAVMNKSGSGVPVFYPHPPPPQQAAAGPSQPPPPQRLPRQGSAAAVAPTVQTAADVRLRDRQGSRRHSFSRQPLFSAVEEMSSSKTKSRHHRHHPSRH